MFSLIELASLLKHLAAVSRSYVPPSGHYSSLTYTKSYCPPIIPPASIPSYSSQAKERVMHHPFEDVRSLFGSCRPHSVEIIRCLTPPLDRRISICRLRSGDASSEEHAMPLRITIPLLIGTRKCVLYLNESFNDASLDYSRLSKLVILTCRTVLTPPAHKAIRRPDQ
jgi:hypothetical protein